MQYSSFWLSITLILFIIYISNHFHLLFHFVFVYFHLLQLDCLSVDQWSVVWNELYIIWFRLCSFIVTDIIPQILCFVFSNYADVYIGTWCFIMEYSCFNAFDCQCFCFFQLSSMIKHKTCNSIICIITLSPSLYLAYNILIAARLPLPMVVNCWYVA